MGTDGGLPSSEFYRFQISVDGRAWNVPPSLWHPDLRTGKWAKLSPNGQKLALGMYGSDGAAAYYVIWYLRADGHHSREFRSTEEAWKWMG